MGICLSKPLMRLSKLPLLMQALLYHTGWSYIPFVATSTLKLTFPLSCRSYHTRMGKGRRSSFLRVLLGMFADFSAFTINAKTRAMALEVDALVRSIEDEKIDEEAREKVRSRTSLSGVSAVKLISRHCSDPRRPSSYRGHQGEGQSAKFDSAPRND